MIVIFFSLSNKGCKVLSYVLTASYTLWDSLNSFVSFKNTNIFQFLFQGVLEQYNRHVKPAFDVFIAPSMTHADIIVPRGGENEVAIDLIVNHVQVRSPDIYS